MKELQNIIHRHFEDPKQKKRYLAVLIALSMLVSFMVPLILMEPADSMTKQRLMMLADDGTSSYPTSFSENISGKADNMVPNAAGTDGNQVGNVIYSPAQMDILTLLFGAENDSNGNLTHQALYAGCETIEETLEVDKETYFLGYASDFCAFIEGDFTATEADAEGRVAVGGDLSFTKSWNYQIGSGDYEKAKSLQTIDKYKEYKNEYDNIYGFASALVGGDMYRINTLSTGSKDKNSDSTRHINPGDNTVYYNPNDGLYKSFVISSADTSGFLHYDEPSSSDIAYGDCKHDFPSDKCTNCTNYNHNHLDSINELSQMYVYPSVRELIQDTFEYVRSRSEVLSHMQSIPGNADSANKKVIFDATGKVSNNVKTVYFSLPSWSADYKEIEFKGIPDGANIVVNCAETGTVYISGSSEDKNKDLQGDWDIKTTLNDTVISIKGMNDPDYKGNNNHPYSSRILYNFYNTNEIHINGSFNGTVLAPNADAESADKGCAGHLSGALIAKSFYGGLEFGYRPYRAGSEILGMTSGYEVPVEKLISGTTQNLAGAMFAIKEGGNVISIFESINGVNHVAIPSDVDFTGNTVYMPELIETGSATKDTTSNVSVNTNLVKPLIVKAYDSSGNEITWDSESDLGDFNIGTTIVLRANQPVEWIQKVYNDTVNFTTNDDNSLTLKINKPIENNAAYNFNVKIKGIDSSEKTLYLNVNPVTITASPTTYNVGDEMKLSVSGISDDVTVKYKYENSSDEIILGDNSSFVTDRIGENKIIAEFYQGENKIYDTSVNVTGVSPDENMKLTISADSYIVGQENIVLSLTGAPSTATIKFYFEDMNNPKQNTTPNSCTIENPTKLGDVAVKAEVWYKNSYNAANTYTGTVKGVLPEMSISVSPENCVVNNNITLSVLAAPQNNTQISYEVKGPNNFHTKNSNFTPNTAGTYTVTVKVVYNGDNNNAVTLTKDIVVNNAEDNSGGTDETTGENNETTEQTTLSSFSIRKGVNRLSTESEQESIKITAPDGKTIKSIKLNTDLINNNTSYSLDVKFYDANNVQKGDTVTVDNNNKDNPINCPDGEVITKIVVEAALGAVKVKSYDVTYTEPCKSVTRTAPFNLQTNSENSYVIDTDVFRNLVASDSSDNKLTDYDSITFTLSSNAAAPNTGVKYWLYKGDQQVEHSDTESFYNGSFTINDLSSRGITKIVIRAKDDTALPIVSYSIKSLTATDTELKPVDNNKEIIHTYVIEEIEAPHGFFPTTDKYEVNVVESFDLENISVVNGKYYPKLVDTVITVNKITKNSDGTESETSVYETKLRIKYGDDTNTRIIEVMNGNEVADTFTIVKSSDALTGVNQIDSVQYNGSELDIDLTKAGIITVGENKYYFNPDTMMIVPMPSENIKFENTPGLLFKKVDDRGYAVKDVEITLTPSTNENGESLWSWVEGTTSEQLINVSQLTPGNVYCISEFDDLDDIYITAPDIFFKYEGGKIYYGASESDLTNELDLINNREIRMVDMRIVGVELEINKVDESGKPLKGAKFDLYADAGEGVPLKSGIEVDNNGKATVNLADVDNSTYVENGYLKPGNYYLIETVIPEHLTDPSNKWYEDPGKIKFRVKDDFTVEYINEQTGGSTEEPTGKQYIESIDSFELDSKTAWNDLNWYWFKINNQYGMEEPYDKDKPDKDGVPEKGFADIKSIVVQFGENTYIEQLYYDSGNLNGASDGNKVEKFNNSTKKFEVTFDQARDIYQFKVLGKDVTVESVQFIASDDTVYSYHATSAASLEDETAVVDETGEGTESESGESTETESGESTEGETGENTGEETPAVERELLEVDNTNSVKVLTVTNKEDDNERDVNVEKRWYDDTGFDDLRPDVTFTLYQSETEITDRSQLSDKIYYQKDENGAFILDDDNNKIPYTITITGPDANGKWTGKFTGLPTKYRNSNDEYVDYHYYIVETPVDGYSIKGYSKDADGTLVAENKLDPVSVKATKDWSDPNGIGTKPESITVQLQVKIGDTWTNVEGKTLPLTAAVNWTGEFTGLVKGKEYRLTESYVNGWEVESNPGSVVNGDPTENLTITNKPKEVEKGSLSISKAWQDAQGKNLLTPNVSEVYVKLYRKVNKLWPVDQPLTSVYNEDGELVTVGVVDDYARLLQYSLYFYDGLMCGSGVDENSAYTWRTDCHKDDEVPGGFHDAGDHAMFGLPAGFTGSNLGWSLYEFRDEYDELGQTAHTKVITDYYADFFSRCIRNNNGTKELLVQKGHGNTDHAYWGIPELQDSRMDPVTMEGRNGKTGWTDGEKTIENEMYWRSDTGADIAAEYAASLALSCLNFYETDPDTYKGYLEKAKELFEYAVGKPALNEWGVNKDEWDPKTYMGFYESHEANDDMSWAAAWIALASKKVADAENNQSYRDDYNSYAATAKTYYDLIDWGWWDLGGYNWNNVKYGAAIANAAYLSDINGCNWDRVNNFVNNSCTGSDYKYINDWGQSRYNAGYQTIALVAAKHQKEGKNVGINATTAAAWAKGQMNYILNNASGYCYVTNFTENSTKRPHYRAGSGTRFEMAEKDDKTVIDGYDKDVNRLIGGMVGGSNGEGICHTDDRGNYQYEDVRSDYCANEVASDYNANLVGAAAGLYYFYRTGELYKIPGVKVQYLPDEEPETQAEETPAPQEEETPAPQAEEQQQSDDNSSNTVDTQTESSNTTASETVSSEQNSAETNTETGENSAQVAKLSSRFSNAFSILSVGFSRLATEELSQPMTYSGSDYVQIPSVLSGNIINRIVVEFYDGSNASGAIVYKRLRKDWNNSYQEVQESFSLPTDNIKVINNVDNITYPTSEIKVVCYSGNFSIKNITFYYSIPEQPLEIVSEKYYLDRNEEFSVDISGHTGDIEWNFDDAPGFSVSPTDNTKLIASGTVGKYTIVGTGSGKTDTIYVEVLPAGTKAYKIPFTNFSGNWDTGDQQVPREIQEYGVRTVALQFDKQGTDSNQVFKAWIDGEKTISFTSIPDNLIYEFKDFTNPVTTAKAATWNNSENVVLKNMYFIYKVSGNLTINPDTMNVIKGETIDIPVSGENGNVEWVAYQNGNAVNDITFNGNSLTAGNATGEYTITGTDEDGKEGTFTLIVEEFRITSDEQIELTEGDANGTVVEANAEAEWSIPEQYADYITITPADGKTSKITVNATDFTTDEIVLTAKYNEETTDTIRIQINAGELNFMSGNSFKVHVGETTEIGFNLPKGVTISGNDTSIAEIVNDGNVWKIKGISKGNTTFAAIRGNEINGTIEVIDPLAITAEGGDNENKKILIYSNKPQQFTASNFVGTVQWTVSGDGIATISGNGLLKPTSAGNVTVTATDADGTTATYDVTIQLGSALVDINGMEPVGEIITISSESEWVATVDNLPVVDANGDYYSYYIVECDKNGNVIENSNPIRGTDGSTYIPISYENGKMLNTGSSTELSVSNRYSGKTQGQMPSSGGVGRTTYYFFGGMIMLLSAAGYTCTRRRQSSRRAK